MRELIFTTDEARAETRTWVGGERGGDNNMRHLNETKLKYRVSPFCMSNEDIDFHCIGYEL